MFWLGILIGVFVGANVGLVLAGLLGGAKRAETCGECLERRGGSMVLKGYAHSA